MSLFKRKKTAKHGSLNERMNELVEQHVFTADFREGLRNHGRLYFEQIIRENGEVFKQELQTTATTIQSSMQAHLATQLDATIQQLNGQIREYVASQLQSELDQHKSALKASQDEVLGSLQKHAADVKAQYEELGVTLKQNIEKQHQAINESLTSQTARMTEMQQAQETALKSLSDNAATLERQYQQMAQILEENVAKHKQMLIDAFQDNMTEVIEHYLASAIGEQFDLRAQLPGIMKQLQSQQKEIAEDMKL